MAFSKRRETAVPESASSAQGAARRLAVDAHSGPKSRDRHITIDAVGSAMSQGCARSLCELEYKVGGPKGLPHLARWWYQEQVGRRQDRLPHPRRIEYLVPRWARIYCRPTWFICTLVWYICCNCWLMVCWFITVGGVKAPGRVVEGSGFSPWGKG